MKMRPVSLALLAALLVAGPPAFGHGDEDHDHAAPAKPAASRGLPGEPVSAQRLPDGSLFVPKAVQRQLGLRTQVATVGAAAATVALNGTVIADPNAAGRVQASQAGRIEPGARGLPVLGQKVTRGQVLAWLRPTPGSIERGNQQALLAELAAALAIAEAKADRYAQLEGAVPRKEIEAARIELQALRRRHAAVGAGLNRPEPLVAPVSGVVGATHAVAGQVVEAKDVLFDVVDPERLAVEALAYDAALLEGIAAAAVPLPGGGLELQFVGGGRQLREQAIPLLFRIRRASAPVAVGQPVRVIARTSGQARGAAVAEAAVVRNGAGQPVVWIHAGAERFVPRPVRHQPLDAATVLVTDGLRGGERVVVDGATLLAQVR